MAGLIAFLTMTGLSAGLAGAAGAALRLIWRGGRREPARFDAGAAAGLVASLPRYGLRHTDFVSSQDQGNYGGALTLVAMAARGWRPVNGKVGGPQGIDGIFVRDGAAGLDAVLIETKTGASPYAEASMSDAKLLGNLDTLYLTAADEALQAVYAEIAAGLKAGSPRIAKELWRHALDTGRTQVVALGPDGEKLSKGRLMDLRHLSEALTAGLREFDRSNAYFSRP
ncbi:MAG: hypothetical protein ACFE0P_08425 [Oceanicaulis sp.]